MKFCPYCGEELPLLNVKFCPECGEKLNAAVDTADTNTSRGVLEEQANKEEKRQWQQEPTYEQQPIYEPNPECVPEPEYVPEPTYEPEYRQSAREVDKVAVAVQAALEFEQHDEPLYTQEDERENYVDYRDADASDKVIIPKPIKAARVRGKGIGIVKILIIVIATAIILGCVAGYAAIKINSKKAPENAVDDFISAVSSGDTSYLLAHMETGDSGLASAEDAKKMCADMTENMDLVAFKGHLLPSEGDRAEGINEKYSAFTFKQTKDTLFSQKFVVKVSAIKATIHTATPDMTLYVDDKPVKGEQGEDGITLKLAPGAHTVRAIYEEYGTEYELGSDEIISFSKNEDNLVSVSNKLGSAEIELSGLETDLQVLIDGEKTDIKQAGGFILLNPAFSGMEVTLKCKEYTEDFTIGSGTSQQFAVDYIKELEEKNIDETAPDAMTNKQLLDIIAPRFYSFYMSYLEAINVWDNTLIHGVSEAYKADIISKMENYNKGLLFNFNELIVDRRSITRENKDGESYASFNVYADFNYAEKKDEVKWLAGGNFQIITMHFNKDTQDWEVSGTVVKDELELSDDIFSIKP